MPRKSPAASIVKGNKHYPTSEPCGQLNGHGRPKKSNPIVALMIEAAEVKPGESVLEVGAGSGYAAAVTAQIAANDAVKRVNQRRPDGVAWIAGAELVARELNSFFDGTADIPRITRHLRLPAFRYSGRDPYIWPSWSSALPPKATG